MTGSCVFFTDMSGAMVETLYLFGGRDIVICPDPINQALENPILSSQFGLSRTIFQNTMPLANRASLLSVNGAGYDS